MKRNSLCIYFMLYLYITSSSIFLLQSSLYNLYTTKKLTKRKVCLIIIDGLRYDSVKNMEFLSSITSSNEGILYKGYTSLPSFSRPGYERILSGTTTEINGVYSNKMQFPSLTPNLLSISKSYGLRTFVSGFIWLYQLYPLSIDNGRYYLLRDGTTFKWAREYLSSNDSELSIIHPMTMDKTGHKFGGASIEYKKASIDIDKELRDLYNFLIERGYTIILTSDHGHLDDGGHGDKSMESTTVPIAIIDRNLKSLNPENNLSNKKSIDIAPTVCDILGIPKSIFMTGNSLVKHSDDIYKIRKYFSSNSSMDFEKYFKLSSIFTNIILSLYSIIFFSSSFIILRLLNHQDNK